MVSGFPHTVQTMAIIMVPNPTATSNYDIHQYTSNGKLSGYSGPLDLNRIVRKGFEYFLAIVPLAQTQIMDLLATQQQEEKLK